MHIRLKKKKKKKKKIYVYNTEHDYFSVNFNQSNEENCARREESKKS